jgi:hypothetical protein
LSVEPLNTLTLGMETKIEHTRSIVVQLCLLHSGCEITTHFFLLSIWAFHHCNILQSEYNYVGVYSGPVDTLIWDLFHWIPLFSLIAAIPFIFNTFCFNGPDLFPVSLFCHLFQYISLLALIVMVPITYKSLFCGPTHPFFLTHTSPFQMATTRTQ